MDGSISGTYFTSCSSSGKRLESPVSGTFQFQSSTDSGTIGFVVQWTQPEGLSCTSWSGNFFYNKEKGIREIKAMWLLTALLDQNEQWADTTIGQTSFLKLSLVI
eukprot:TRINITY_DN10493_c0_g1_i1.p1 TRINITY_DN10493_c0_g1~~TRINITY_DN10493_c0_g1_i1.p1  ORF type:complete len:105 (+),score=7.16 TRINITY_DN10493_c0_g1_i1:203-517(+)